MHAPPSEAQPLGAGSERVPRPYGVAAAPRPLGGRRCRLVMIRELVAARYGRRNWTTNIQQ
jgi:hypothetical protein